MAKRSLAETHPQVADQWHPTKNLPLTPHDVSKGSHQRVWWKCSLGEDHEWVSSVCNRTTEYKRCPCCLNQIVVPSKSIVVTHPLMAAQWHPTKNKDLLPTQFTRMSNKKVWWKCSIADDHEWLASPNNRLADTICPLCCGRRLSSTNRLSVIRPDVARMWHPTKNGSLQPEDVSFGIAKKVWWKCPEGDDHVFEKSINSMTMATRNGCPMCKRRTIVPSTCLDTTHPQLADQWHPTKNGQVTPKDVSAGSGLYFWWVCSEGHEWKAMVKNRRDGTGCKTCQESGGEFAVETALKATGNLYKREYRFPACKHIHSLPFDFVVGLPFHKPMVGAIEYHGRQHYKSVNHFGGEAAFEGRKKRDAIKVSFCEERGIPLLVIPYWELDNTGLHVHNFVRNTPPCLPRFKERTKH